MLSLSEVKGTPNPPTGTPIILVTASAIEKACSLQSATWIGNTIAENYTNAATTSQSSALEPGDFVFRRRCKRKTTAMHASAINIAFVAIIARDAEVVMLHSRKILLQRKRGENKGNMPELYDGGEGK